MNGAGNGHFGWRGVLLPGKELDYGKAVSYLATLFEGKLFDSI